MATIDFNIGGYNYHNKIPTIYDLENALPIRNKLNTLKEYFYELDYYVSTLAGYIDQTVVNKINAMSEDITSNYQRIEELADIINDLNVDLTEIRQSIQNNSNRIDSAETSIINLENKLDEHIEESITEHNQIFGFIEEAREDITNLKTTTEFHTTSIQNLEENKLDASEYNTWKSSLNYTDTGTTQNDYPTDFDFTVSQVNGIINTVRKSFNNAMITGIQTTAYNYAYNIPGYTNVSTLQSLGSAYYKAVNTLKKKADMLFVSNDKLNLAYKTGATFNEYVTLSEVLFSDIFSYIDPASNDTISLVFDANSGQLEAVVNPHSISAAYLSTDIELFDSSLLGGTIENGSLKLSYNNSQFFDSNLYLRYAGLLIDNGVHGAIFKIAGDTQTDADFRILFANKHYSNFYPESKYLPWVSYNNTLQQGLSLFMPEFIPYSWLLDTATYNIDNDFVLKLQIKDYYYYINNFSAGSYPSINSLSYTDLFTVDLKTGLKVGQAEGLATLDSNGHVPASQLDIDLSPYALKDEMAVSSTGDKTTITLKNGLSTTVLNAHQDLSGKVDKETGKGLSTNDYTTAEKDKLSGVEDNAQKNVQSDWNVTDTSKDAYIKNKPDALKNPYALTIQKNGTTINGSYDGSAEKTVNITVPTKTSELTNDSGYTTGDASKIYLNAAATPTSGYAKTYNVYQGGTAAANLIGTIDIPKDLVVKSGSLVTVNNKQYLRLVLSNDAQVDIDLQKLVDVYTGSTGTHIKITVTDYQISATLVQNSISIAYLASDVTTKLNQIDINTSDIEDINATLITINDRLSNAESAITSINSSIQSLRTDVTAAKTVINLKTSGHVTVSKTVGTDGNDIYTISENDIASASTLTSHVNNTTVHITSAERTTWNEKQDSSVTMETPTASDTQITSGSKTIISVLKTFANNIKSLFDKVATNTTNIIKAKTTVQHKSSNQYVTVTSETATDGHINYIIDDSGISAIAPPADTDALPEGHNNLYFTTTRVQAVSYSVSSYTENITKFSGTQNNSAQTWFSNIANKINGIITNLGTKLDTSTYNTFVGTLNTNLALGTLREQELRKLYTSEIVATLSETNGVVNYTAIKGDLFTVQNTSLGTTSSPFPIYDGNGLSIDTYSGESIESNILTLGRWISYFKGRINWILTHNTDEKVTSVDNHYTPVENSASQINAATNYYVSGIKRDAKGHVTGIATKALPTDSDTKNTVGDANDETNTQYVVGVSTNGSTQGYGVSKTNKNIYFKEDTIYGMTNDYRYNLTGSWNLLSGKVANNLYDTNMLYVGSNYNTYTNVNPSTGEAATYFADQSDGTKYLRLGRLVTNATTTNFPKGAYNCSFILHVHSQRLNNSNMYGNGFTCIISKPMASNTISVTPLTLDNSDSMAQHTFESIIAYPTTVDGYQGVDLILKFRSTGNVAIVATAMMLSDIADLHLEESYKGTFQFTYQAGRQKEYILEHPGFSGYEGTNTEIPKNKSSLYIANSNVDYSALSGAVSYSLDPKSKLQTNTWIDSDSYAALTSVETNTVYYITEL